MKIAKLKLKEKETERGKWKYGCRKKKRGKALKNNLYQSIQVHLVLFFSFISSLDVDGTIT